MSEGEEKFEKTDAGASDAYPVECGTIKKGSYMVFENRPCKVVGYTTAKTGKHGHAKAKKLQVLIFLMEKNMKTLSQLPILLWFQISKDPNLLLLMLMLMDI